jgi:uncharacterized protein
VKLQFKGDLPDVNVWLALSAPHHSHHAVARAYWNNTAAAKVWFCRHTALGMKRLLGQSAVMKDQVQSSAQCWASWQTWLAVPEVGMQSEPLGLDASLHELQLQANWPGGMWPDAYLAAFAIAGNLRLVSFDRDFSRFVGLDWLHLTAA